MTTRAKLTALRATAWTAEKTMWRAYQAAKEKRKALDDRIAKLPPDPVKATLIDVSNNQGTIDFKRVKAALYDGVYVKATEGDWTDPTFARNVKAAKAAGLKVGAYAFLRPKPGRSGAQEAAFFIRHLRDQGLGKGDLRPVLDCEHIDEKTKRPLLTGAALRSYVETFADALRKAGFSPIIYTGTWWWEPFIGPHDFGCPLWIAAYQKSEPRLPAPWKSYVLWQHTSSASVPGVNGHCDANKCPDLRKLVA